MLQGNSIFFSIGAGDGCFEKTLVEELNLKLNYFCGIEPVPFRAGKLNEVIISLGIECNIIQSPFDKEFRFVDKRRQNFDLIMFCHSLYSFQDPHEAILHSKNFLKPDGKIFIIHQGEGAVDAIQNYLVSRSDPNIYSISRCISDETLTAEKILTLLAESSPDLSTSVMEEISHTDVDDFVRKTEAPGSSDIISFCLQAEYGRLSEETKENIHRTVVNHCDVVDGRYFVKSREVGIVLSTVA